MNQFEDIPNSKIKHLIDEYIHNKRDREILQSRFIDGFTYERIAEIFDLSVTQVKSIIYKQGDKILRHLQ